MGYGELYRDLIGRLTAWVEARSDLRALVVFGSRARADHPADEWSGLDVLVTTTRPERYASGPEWLEELGPWWLTFIESVPMPDGIERRVLFDGGLDVDFVIVPQSPGPALLGERVIAAILGRGSRVLVDKDRLMAALEAPAPASPAWPPSPAEFLDTVHDFLYHAVWTAKKLRRGEIWVAKSCCDGYMKDRLLRIIEWHARATQGDDHDTWYGGRFLEEWADVRAVASLRMAFARYDGEDVRRTLYISLALFRSLAKETAAELGYAYPQAADGYVSGLVEDLCA